ncbi:MAG TPA: TolC family protein, partial [Gemmata sp.]|nr:TolC family protein [Gemmata sp.]
MYRAPGRQEAEVGHLKWTRQAVRWLAIAGLVCLPACAAIDPIEPPPRLPRSARLPTGTARLRPESATVIPAAAQERAAPKDEKTDAAPTPSLPAVPAAETQGKPLPIDLPTALRLTNANPLDIQIAGERLQAAHAAFQRAKVMWLPNIGLGVEYFRHDGQLQAIEGRVFTTSKSAFFVGAGPTAVFPLTEALYAPIAARQIVRAREAEVQAARNDTTLQVAEAYFTVQQARGEVAGAIDTLRRAEELVKITQKIAPELAPTVEINRARTELARRRQAVEAAYERWEVASADLTRILRLEPGTLVEPAEEPAVSVELLDPATTADALIPIALTNRPELAADQAIIQAALARVKQEKIRPFIPTIAVRGVGSQVPGLAGGYFGGGVNGFVGNFGGRFSIDLQAVWEVQNLGFGNRATIRERQAEQGQSLLQLLKTKDIVTAEVVQAQSRARRSANRLKEA